MPLLGICPSDLSSSSSIIMAPSSRLLPTWPAPLSAKASVELPWRTIRMGGGPRTFPGGVSKWEWKRMQAKKAKQLLKARLCRERQIYEMRRRAELRAAVAELERPWEAVETAPALFSVRADEQVQVLADRFNRPGGCDLWTEQDGPQLFFRAPGGNPSARFFPGGAVHSVKPYEVAGGGASEGGEGPARSSSRMSRRRRDGGAAGVDTGKELLKQDGRKTERDLQKAASLSDSEMSYNARRRRRDGVGGRERRVLPPSGGGLKSSFNRGRDGSKVPGRYQSDSELPGFRGRRGHEEDDF